MFMTYRSLEVKEKQLIVREIEGIISYLQEKRDPVYAPTAEQQRLNRISQKLADQLSRDSDYQYLKEKLSQRLVDLGTQFESMGIRS